MLRVRADAPVFRRDPRGERRWFVFVLAAVLGPGALPLGFLLIWWISDDNRDRLFPLYLVGLLARISYRGQETRNPSFVVIRVAQRVCHKHTGRCFRGPPCQINHRSKDAE